MVKFTKKSLIIEIETDSPAELLLKLQNAILNINIQTNLISNLANDDDIIMNTSDPYSWYILLNFLRDISPKFETNPYKKVVSITKKSLIIEIETDSPAEDLLILQNAILNINIQKISMLDISKSDDIEMNTSNNYAWYILLNFLREISPNPNTNEKMFTKIINALKEEQKA